MSFVSHFAASALGANIVKDSGGDDSGGDVADNGGTSEAAPTAQDVIGGNVEAAEQTKLSIAEQSESIGDVVAWLDSMAFKLGGARISIWDCIFVIAVIALVCFLAWATTHFVNRRLKKSNRLDPSQEILAEKALTIVIWMLAIIIGFDVLGIDLTALAVFSGAFGLAVGFGLQKTIGNFIAGIILLMDKSIKPGDIIAVSDQAGNLTSGQIRKIGIRAVSITTRDGKEYLIPNENLMVNQVENWSYLSKEVRIHIPVGVAYSCDITLAEKLMLEAARSCERVLADPQPSVWLSRFGEDAVEFTINCWILDPEGGIGNVKSMILKKLWILLQENELEVPFPQRDITMRESPQLDKLINALAKRSEAPSD